MLHDLAHNGDQAAKTAAVIERVLQVKQYPSLKWTQVLAADALIGGRTFDQAAGEGKTEAFDTASGVLALEHGSVLRITSTRTLAERDAATLREILDPLGVDVIRVDHNAHLPEPERPTVYVTDINELGFYDNHWGEGVPTDRVIADEADVLKDLLDRGMVFVESDGVHAAAEPTVADQVHWADRAHADTFTAADFTRDADGAWRLTDPARGRLADALLDEHRIDTFGSDPLAAAEHRLARAHAAAELIENKDYLNYRGENNDQPGRIVIIDPLSGEPLYDPATNLEQRWQDGLAQAVEARHGIDIHADPTSDKTTTLQGVLDRYPIKVGASGTAKPAEAALESLGFGAVAEIPRHDPNRLDARPDRVHESELTARQALVDDIVQHWDGGHGRPIQVIVHRNDWVARIADELLARGVPRDAVQALDAKWLMDQGTGREPALGAAFGPAGELGRITITGGFGGRGTNITPVEDAYAVAADGTRTGGLRVLGTGRSADTARSDIQLETRAGRNGNPGEAQFYGYLDHELLAGHATDPDVARFLDDARDVLAQPDSAARDRALDDLGRRHAELIRRLQDVVEYRIPIAVSHNPPEPPPSEASSDPAPDAHTYRPHQHAPPAAAVLPYRRGPGEPSNAQALATPSPAAIARLPGVVHAVTTFLFDRGLTGGVDPSAVEFEIADSPAAIAHLDFQERSAETTTVAGRPRIRLGPAAFDGGLEHLAEVSLHELARVDQLRHGVTDPHDPVAEAAARAAQRQARGIFWETIAVDDSGTLTRWGGPHSVQGPRSNVSVAADPATLPHTELVVRDTAALLGVDLTGVQVAIVNDPAQLAALDERGELADVPFGGHGQQIDFGRGAFASWATLAKTIAYQAERAAQLRAGRLPLLAPRPDLEADAIEALVEHTPGDAGRAGTSPGRAGRPVRRREPGRPDHRP